MLWFKKCAARIKEAYLSLYAGILASHPIRSFKYAARTEREIKNVIVSWCRIENNSRSYSGENSYEDNLYNHVANVILGLVNADATPDGIDKDAAKSIIDKIEKQYKNELVDLRDDFLKLRSSTNDSITDLNELNNIIRSHLIKCILVRNKYKKWLKKSEKIISDRRAEKYNIDFAKLILKFSTIISIFIYIGGYVYISFLFWLFSFEPSSYFYLTEYATVPLSKVIWALVYAAGLVFMVLVIRSEKSRTHKSILELDERRYRNVTLPLIILVLITSLLNGIFGKSVSDFIMAGLIVAMLLFPYVLDRYVKYSFETFLWVFFSIIFISKVLFTANTEYTRINNNNSIASQEFGNHNKSIPGKSKYIFILKNEEYYFYFDKVKQSVVAIPKDKLNMLLSR